MELRDGNYELFKGLNIKVLVVAESYGLLKKNE
jgi:hypothetical protein